MHAHAYMSVFASSLSYHGRSAGESVVAAVGDNSDEEPEPRDWDLNILCDALLVKRALVPVSQKSAINFFSNPTRGIKRRETRIDCNFIPPFLESEYLRREAHTIRSSSLLIIWIRLLESVLAGHAHFPAVRTSHVITHLLSDNDELNPNLTIRMRRQQQRRLPTTFALQIGPMTHRMARQRQWPTRQTRTLPRDDKVSSFNSHRLSGNNLQP